jgi:hypothetical protein
MNPVTVTKNLDGDTTSGPSPAIWKDCPILDIIVDPGVGYHFFDDFLNTPVLSTGATTGLYTTFADTGTTLTQVATETGGVFRIVTDTTDNDEAWLTTGGNTGVMGVINTAANSGKKLWFEARVRPNQITNGNWLLALAEEGLAAENTLSDAGAIADKDVIGFSVSEDDSDGIDFVYNTASGGGVTRSSPIKVLAAASTWVKLGITYDPAIGIYYFVDGLVYNATAVAASATNIPDTQELALLLGVKNNGTTAVSLDIDWWRFAQLR